MRLWPKSLKWRAVLLTLIGLVAVGVSVSLTFGKAIRTAVYNQLAVLRLRDDPDPATRGLARGEIRPGDSVEELIAAHPPKRVDRHGRFVEVRYASGLTVIAADGRLAFAKDGWCSAAVIIFDRLSPDDEREYSASSSADLDRRCEELMLPHRALAGVAGYRAGCEPPPEKEESETVP